MQSDKYLTYGKGERKGKERKGKERKSYLRLPTRQEEAHDADQALIGPLTFVQVATSNIAQLAIVGPGARPREPQEHGRGGLPRWLAVADGASPAPDLGLVEVHTERHVRRGVPELLGVERRMNLASCPGLGSGLILWWQRDERVVEDEVHVQITVAKGED